MVSLVSTRISTRALEAMCRALYDPARRGQQRCYPVDPDVPRTAARVTLGPGPLWPGEPAHPRRRPGGSNRKAIRLRPEDDCRWRSGGGRAAELACAEAAHAGAGPGPASPGRGINPGHQPSHQVRMDQGPWMEEFTAHHGGGPEET